MNHHIDQVVANLVCAKDIVPDPKQHALHRTIPSGLNARIEILDEIILQIQSPGQFEKDPVIADETETQRREIGDEDDGRERDHAKHHISFAGFAVILHIYSTTEKDSMVIESATG